MCLCGKIPLAQQRGPMAQLGARLNGIEEAVGSSPTRSTRESANALALLVKEKDTPQRHREHRDFLCVSQRKNFVNFVPLW